MQGLWLYSVFNDVSMMVYLYAFCYHKLCNNYKQDARKRKEGGLEGLQNKVLLILFLCFRRSFIASHCL